MSLFVKMIIDTLVYVVHSNIDERSKNVRTIDVECEVVESTPLKEIEEKDERLL